MVIVETQELSCLLKQNLPVPGKAGMISALGLQLRAVDLVEPLATLRRQFLKLIQSLI